MDETMELVVTLSVPQKRIVKVEALDPSGTRRLVADQDFAELVGEDEQETLVAALEEAYAAGAEDALDDEEGGEEGQPEAPHRVILWEAAARQDLRRSVRRLILGRALRRLSSPKRDEPARTAKKGTSDGKRSTARQQQRA